MLGTLTLPAGKPVCFSSEMIPCPLGTAVGRIPAAGRRFTNQKCKAGATCAFATVEPATVVRTTGSLYEVLRVKRTASLTEIKSAYRSLAKMYHPDAVQSDGRDFMEIHNAYETLSDPAARAVYDLSLGAQQKRRPSGFSSRNRAGFYPFQKWETDQCW